MFNIDKQKLSKALEDVLRQFGYEGDVTIENGEVRGEYLIHHSAFGCPFVGLHSRVREYVTVITSDHRYTDLNGLDRAHKEGIVFDAYTMVPLYYSIFNEPEYQRVMITDFLSHKKGDIVYSNNCISGGYRQHNLVRPIFESEVFDLHAMVNTLRYNT